MPDPIFADHRLASLYDAFDGRRDGLAPYVQIADQFGAQQVLDTGCGTGCLALLLAGTGRPVTAVDTADASLDVARCKPGAESSGFTTVEVRDAPNRPGREFVFVARRA